MFHLYIDGGSCPTGVIVLGGWMSGGGCPGVVVRGVDVWGVDVLEP